MVYPVNFGLNIVIKKKKRKKKRTGEAGMIYSQGEKKEKNTSKQ